MRLHLFLAWILWLTLPGAVGAQSNASDGALQGFVRDPSGASVPSATVLAMNLATNQVRETTVDQSGFYRFPLLQVGDYRLIVTAPGFAEFQQAGIRLSVGEQARVDVTLAIGATTEAVTVTADASMVLAGQGASGAVLSEQGAPHDLAQCLQLSSRGAGREGHPEHRVRHDAVSRRRPQPDDLVDGRPRQLGRTTCGRRAMNA